MGPRTIAALLWGLALSLPAGAAAQVPTPLTPPGQISSTGSPLDFGTGAEAPVLGYDPVSRRVLALWHVRGGGDTRRVRGRVLDARGRPLGSQFAPAIAFDPRGGRGVIAWFLDAQRARGGVFARGVDARGRPAGRVRAIFRPPKDALSIDGRLALGFQPRTRRWLVAWRQFLSLPRTQRRPAKNLFARRVLSDGLPRGPVHALAATGSSSGTPVLAAHSGRAHTLVLYAGDDGEGRNFLHVLRLGTGGAPFGGRRTVSVTEQPLAAASPSVVRLVPGRLLLTYVRACRPVGHEGCPQFAPVVARALNPFGAAAGVARVIVEDAVGRSATLVATGPRSSLLAWEGAALSGPPTFSDDAMTTVFPHKSEIFVRPQVG